jgi:hypothetical protein
MSGPTRTFLIKTVHWLQSLPAVRDVHLHSVTIVIGRHQDSYAIDAVLEIHRPEGSGLRPLMFRRFESPLQLDAVSAQEASVFTPALFSKETQYFTVGLISRGQAKVDGMQVRFRYTWNPTTQERLPRLHPLCLVMPNCLYQPASLVSHERRISVRRLPKVQVRLEAPGTQLILGGISSDYSPTTQGNGSPPLLQALLLFREGCDSEDAFTADEDPVVVSPTLAQNLSGERLRLLQSRTRELLAFFGSLFGGTPLMRLILIHPRDCRGLTRAAAGAAVLGISPRDASAGLGKAVNIEPLATQVASLWWGGGCRLIGRDAEGVESAIRTALALLWLSVIDRERCERALYAHRKRAGSSSAVDFWTRLVGPIAVGKATRLALSVFEELQGGAGLAPKLAAYTKQHWGCLIPARRFLDDLALSNYYYSAGRL